MDSRVEVATKYAWTLLGQPYAWGGDDSIQGFDCSGLCIEILKSVGVLPRTGDWTAHGLWDLFRPLHKVRAPFEGCLVFWKSSSALFKIVHVEYCINETLCIGASGGGSNTTSRAAAAKHNAFVKIRPWTSRKNAVGFVYPFAEIK